MGFATDTITKNGELPAGIISVTANGMGTGDHNDAVVGKTMPPGTTAPSLAKLDTSTAATAAAAASPTTKDGKPVHVHIEPGCQPEAVYAAALSPWRESMRKFIFNALKHESEMIAELQKKVRTPARDKYFFWSAVLGSELL